MNELTPQDQALIDRIKAKVASRNARRLEQGKKLRSHPPASPERVTDAENMLGFALPALIREIYVQVGNGGFGPGQGIAGLEGGTLMYDEWTMPGLSRWMRGVDPAQERAYRTWKPDYIVYCEWGCNVDTVVDCASPDLTVYTWENPPGIRKNSAGTLRT